MLLLKEANKDAVTELSHGCLAFALLAAGADINLQFGEGKESAVHMTVRSGVGVLRALIENGTDANAAGQNEATTLHT